MTYPMPTNGVIDELREAVKAAIEEQHGKVEEKLKEFGLTFADIPTRLLREQNGDITRYIVDDKPIFETEIFITANSIRFEIRPL